MDVLVGLRMAVGLGRRIKCRRVNVVSYMPSDIDSAKCTVSRSKLQQTSSGVGESDESWGGDVWRVRVEETREVQIWRTNRLFEFTFKSIFFLSVFVPNKEPATNGGWMVPV